MKKMLKLIKNSLIEKDEPKADNVVLRGLDRNGKEYSVTIPTFKIEKDGYHQDPCFIRAGKRK